MSKVSGRLTPPPPAAIAAALKIEKLTIDWLAGDGSDRCYFRVRSPQLPSSLVLMQLSGTDAENLKRGQYDWVEVSNILKAHKIAAPTCVAALSDYAALLIDDYGDTMLETAALTGSKNSSINGILPLFEASLEVVGQFLAIPATPGNVWTKRSFDRDRFVWELRFFISKYLEPIGRYTLSNREIEEFDNDIKALSSYLASNSRFFVHRDFHSRNVMVHNNRVAIIDFQDARLGPPSYDLVSLVFDSYVPLPPEIRLSLLEKGFDFVKLYAGQAAYDRAKEEWRPMLLQRQLKAIGSFGYLTVDKHKGDYLRNVAPALQTLFDAGVQDSRWPFLSGRLLQILANTLPDRTSSSSNDNEGLSLAAGNSHKFS
jgi:aminoglycoside/choline kinase family phosphotransferase